jgi:hypothetical protein
MKRDGEIFEDFDEPGTFWIAVTADDGTPAALGPYASEPDARADYATLVPTTH